MKYLELVVRNSCGKQNSRQVCIGIRWMGEMQILLKLMMKKTLQREFWQKKSKKEESGYMNCKFLLPTSNIVERFFSLSGIALNEHRQSLTSEHLEEQFFLKVNKRFWSPQTVESAYNQ